MNFPADLQLAIPTYMRETNQYAYRLLPSWVKKHTVLYAHSGRANLLRQAQPGATVMDLGVTDGIADVRQKVIDTVALTHDKVLIVDDQCKFYSTERVSDTARKPGSRWLRDSDGDAHWEAMLQGVSYLLDQYPQVGICPRPGNNRYPEPHTLPGRAYSAFGLNLSLLRKHGVRFDGMYQKDHRIKLYEDFYLTLSLLTRGQTNVIWNEYCCQSDHGKAGGNSTIRTNALQKLCAEALAAEFPAYVTVVQQATKTFKLDSPEDTHRWEVRIQWKRALTDALGRNLL